MTRQRRALTTTALSLIVSCLVAPAQAAPTMDYFSHNTPGMKKAAPRTVAPRPLPETTPRMTQEKNDADARLGAGALAIMSANTPVVRWFESFDNTIAILRPSDTDKIILTRSLTGDQQAERVQEWTRTAGRVSQNWRRLSKTLKTMPVPPNLPGLKDYRDLIAEWYADKAGVYEDLVKPRPAARTIEELNAQLQEIQDRSQSIADTGKNLHGMDENLRKTFRVHLARHEDPLAGYVMNQLK